MNATAPIRTPRVYEKTGSLLVGTGLSGTASVAPSTVMGVAVLSSVSQLQPEPGYHLPAKHDDPFAFGLEWAVAVTAAALFVGAKAPCNFRL